MQRRSILLLGASLALMLGAAPAQAASRTVWSGLVIANNVEQPDAIPPELTHLEGKLKQLFGYNQFKVIGQSQKALVPAWKIGWPRANISRSMLIRKAAAMRAMF